MKATSTSPKAKDKLLRLGAVLFWLLIWQLGSMAVNQEILLVSPVSACATLIRLMGEGSFYQAVFGSFGRILAGFALSTVLGVLLAALSCAFFRCACFCVRFCPPSRRRLWPPSSFLRSSGYVRRTFPSSSPSLWCCPSPTKTCCAGWTAPTQAAGDGARVPRALCAAACAPSTRPRRFPMLLTAVRLSLGMCWKAGIAAEVIAQPRNSIGSALQQAKLFFATPEMFAWTLAIILLSVGLEKLVVLLITAAQNGEWRGRSADHSRHLQIVRRPPGAGKMSPSTFPRRR